MEPLEGLNGIMLRRPGGLYGDDLAGACICRAGRNDLQKYTLSHNEARTGV